MESPLAKGWGNTSNYLTENYADSRRYVNMLDLKQQSSQQIAMEAFFFGYQAFTAKADEMLERRGLSRVHQRIVFFIARYPELSVKELLALLGVSKQALNTPLRQLLEMHLVNSVAPACDKRKRLLQLTAEGARFDHAYYRDRHMPLVKARLGSACAYYTVEKGLVGGAPGASPGAPPGPDA